MFKKFFLAAAVVAAGLFVTNNQASAGHGCYSGYPGHHYHRPSISYRSFSPYHYRSYRVPTHRYYGHGHGYYPGGSYFRGGYGIGSSYYRGGSYFRYGGPGFSIGIGF